MFYSSFPSFASCQVACFFLEEPFIVVIGAKEYILNTTMIFF